MTRNVESWPVEEPLRLWPQMQAVTLDIIVRTIFGLEEGERMDRLRARLRDGAEMTTAWPTMAAMALLGPDRVGASRAFRTRIEPIDEVVFAEIRRRRGATDLAERDDILSMLLQARDEDGELMGDRELRDELMTLLVAGHETTATSLSWALERLVRHPEALQRLQDEVRAGESDEWMTAVIRETMRLCPVISITVRELQEPVEIARPALVQGAMEGSNVQSIVEMTRMMAELREFQMATQFLEREGDRQQSAIDRLLRRRS